MKIGQIRATLSKSVAYIVNGAKTEQGSLVSTFGCAPLTGDTESIVRDFLAVQNAADEARGVGRRPTVQGLHIIQSFKPGEIDATRAHQVGGELADGISSGDYQWVLTTHTDRGHVHNHIIMNPVNLSTLERYRTPKDQIFVLRALSDELCRSHGLSVVASTAPERDTSHLGERYARTQGRSTKDELRTRIDSAVTSATTIGDLIGRLEAVGVEVTFRGRSMLVRDIETMSRPLRSWRLGPAYSESNLAARIGQSPVATFTVKPSMVTAPAEGMCRVKIPGLRGNFLVVPATALVDHGSTWHIHLSDTNTTPVVDSAGIFQAAFTTEQLSTWFTPLTPERVIDPQRDTLPARGRSDAQRRYFAAVDRRVASFAHRMEHVNQRAEIARLTPEQRAEARSALRIQQQLRSSTMQQLLIRRDQSSGGERDHIERQITRLQRTIRADQTATDLLTREPNQDRTSTRKGPRR